MSSKLFLSFMCVLTSSFPLTELFCLFATKPLQVLPCSFVTFHPPLSVLLRILMPVWKHHINNADTKLNKRVGVSLVAPTTSEENAAAENQFVLFCKITITTSLRKWNTLVSPAGSHKFMHFNLKNRERKDNPETLVVYVVVAVVVLHFTVTDCMFTTVHAVPTTCIVTTKPVKVKSTRSFQLPHTES